MADELVLYRLIITYKIPTTKNAGVSLTINWITNLTLLNSLG